MTFFHTTQFTYFTKPTNTFLNFAHTKSQPAYLSVKTCTHTSHHSNTNGKAMSTSTNVQLTGKL